MLGALPVSTLIGVEWCPPLEASVLWWIFYCAVFILGSQQWKPWFNVGVSEKKTPDLVDGLFHAHRPQKGNCIGQLPLPYQRATCSLGGILICVDDDLLKHYSELYPVTWRLFFFWRLATGFATYKAETLIWLCVMSRSQVWQKGIPTIGTWKIKIKICFQPKSTTPTTVRRGGEVGGLTSRLPDASVTQNM